MQPNRRSETIVYAAMAVISLILTGITILIIVLFTRSQRGDQVSPQMPVQTTALTATHMESTFVTGTAGLQPSKTIVLPNVGPGAASLPPGTTGTTLDYAPTETSTQTARITATPTESALATVAASPQLSRTVAMPNVGLGAATPEPETKTATPRYVPTETITPTLTPCPTPTTTPSSTRTATATATATPSATPTVTPTVTASPTPTLTPAPSVTPIPSATATIPAPPTVTPTPLIGASKAAALVPTGEYDILNILLLGSDLRPNDPSYRTDTLIVVSVNRTTNTVNMLSIPRDLYLYIPGYGMDRINTASIRGDIARWQGRGAGLIAYTIQYNLGIRIDRYARINFAGFKQIVDALGGIDVAVDCPLTDYRLASAKLDPNTLANYRLFTLPIGYHHMDGSLALWFARSRETTSDFDRNRRQQMVLRAIWRKLMEQNVVNNLATLWDQATKIVETNLTLVDAAGLVPIAIDLDSTRMHSYFLGPEQVKDWTTPDGAAVLLPLPKAIRDIVTRLYTPPTENQLVAEQPTLVVYNGTTQKAWDKVATSRLSWEGFAPVDAGNAESTAYPHTLIYDYTGNAKPSSRMTLQRVLGVRKDDIIDAPNPNRDVDFRIILGASYNACTYSAWRTPN